MVLMGQTQPPSNRQSLSEGEMAEQKKENSSKFISVELAATRLEIRDEGIDTVVLRLHEVLS